MNRMMWGLMVDHYGRENLKKLTLEEILEVAWWFYINPINEKRIKEILLNAGAKFKEL